MKILYKIISIYFCVKGKSCLSNHNFVDALIFFQKAEKYMCIYDVMIYKGVAEFFLGKIDNSIISLQYALQLVQEDKKLTKNEKIYLQYYILEILLDSLKTKDECQNIKDYEEKFKNLKFKKNLVRKRLLNWFPIHV